MNLSQPEPIKVVGFDPSLRSWGIAIGSMIPGVPASLQINSLNVLCPVLSESKQVRQNSLDLESAKQLAEGAIAAAQGAQAIFVEVPVGSQSARAMAGYAICCGVLGALRATGIQFFEVTPSEVKLAATGKTTATKREMIQWAKTKHPETTWPTYKKQGKLLISEGTAEHMADAVGAIYAGLSCNSYQQMLTFMRQRTS